MTRTLREYFPVHRGGLWVGEGSHHINTGFDDDLDHDPILSLGQFGSKAFDYVIWFVMDIFEEPGYTPMRARIELTPSVDADTQGPGRFRFGHVRTDGAWDGATMFGFGIDTYPDTTVLPYPTADNSDVIIPGVLYLDTFALFPVNFATWTKDTPVSFGDYTFADFPLNFDTDPDAQGTFASGIGTNRDDGGKTGQMCFVLDPYLIPPTGVEAIEFYGAGWNQENGGVYLGPKCVVEWEVADSTASVPDDIQARVGVPLASLVPVGLDAGAELVVLHTTGPVSLGLVASDAGAGLIEVCSAPLASLGPAAKISDAGATLGPVFTMAPVSFGPVAADAGASFGYVYTTGTVSLETTERDAGATLGEVCTAGLAVLTPIAADAGATIQ